MRQASEMQEQHWSELDLIEMIDRRCRRQLIASPEIIKGIGDDCAVLRPNPGRDWVVTTDMLVDTVHFDTAWHPAEKLGRKCLSVNLSDIAAMGGEPQFVLLSLALPGSITKTWLDDWMTGFTTVLNDSGCRLIGGDTVRAPVLTINITVQGTVPQGRALTRDGAGPGESVFVSGPLGSAALGLVVCQEMQAGSIKPDHIFLPFVERHLNPAAELECARILAASGMVSAMQDISDGLATDLAHICQKSGLGAVVEAELLPSDEDFQRACSIMNLDPLELQISGGDDYRLVFTVRAGKDEELFEFLRKNNGPPIYRVGCTEAGNDVRLISSGHMRTIGFSGFQHKG